MNKTIKQTNFFLPYQIKWIQDDSPVKLMVKSRQVGISWTTAYNLVRKSSTSSKPTDSWVSSRDELQAKLFLDDCKSFSKIINTATTFCGIPIINSSNKPSSFAIQFANNSRIHSMSSNPDAQAGKRGTRVLDEFALHPDPKKLYTIASPGTTWGGQLEIISTHRGSQNFFNQLIQEIQYNGNPKNISLHTVTLQDALDQGFLKKLKEKLPCDDLRQLMDNDNYFNHIRSSCPDEESFLQEYMCQPSDDQSAFMPYDLITQAEFPLTTNWELHPSNTTPFKNNFYLGVDIARKNDLSVFWLLEEINGSFFTRQVISLKDTPFSIQEETLYSLLEHPNLIRACIDQSGLGRQFTERAIQKFNPFKVQGINFTNTSKEQLAYPLRTAFENNQVKIPQSNLIRSSLRAIKKETSSHGNTRFTADHGTNGHADHFWALALALNAAQKAKPNYYSTIPKNFNRKTLF